MLRLFAEHKLRKAITLEGVWRLTPLDCAGDLGNDSAADAVSGQGAL